MLRESPQPTAQASRTLSGTPAELARPILYAAINARLASLIVPSCPPLHLLVPYVVAVDVGGELPTTSMADTVVPPFTVVAVGCIRVVSERTVSRPRQSDSRQTQTPTANMAVLESGRSQVRLLPLPVRAALIGLDAVSEKGEKSTDVTLPFDRPYVKR